MIWNDKSLSELQSHIDNGLNYKQIAKIFLTTSGSVEHAVRRHELRGMKTIQAEQFDELERVDIVGCEEESLEKFKNTLKSQWTIPKSKVPKNGTKPYKIMLVSSDHHVPHHNVPAMKALMKLMDDVKFDINVILGDFYDSGIISHWNTNKKKTLEGKRLKEDYIVCNTILDGFDTRLPAGAEKHYFLGNHESWFDDLIENMPQLEGIVEPLSQMKLIERGYKVYKYNEIITFGRLNLTHGIYCGGNPIKKHIDELKVNVMFGHTHQLGMQFSSSPAREIAFAGYNTGCMANLSPDYMKNRPHAWTHGFAVVYLYPNNYFDVNLIRVINGKFIFNGKIYDGN